MYTLNITNQMKRSKQQLKEKEYDMELSEETKRDIEEARKEFKKGKFVTFEQILRELKLK